MSQNIIQLNGRTFDSRSGKPITPKAGIAATQPSKRVMDIAKPGRSIASTTVHHKTMPNKHVQAKATAKPQTKPLAKRQLPHHVHAHRPETASTLMRSAVKKPKPQKATPGLKVRAAVDSAFTHTTLAVRPKVQVDPKRLERANNTPKSQGIQRFFGSAMPATIPSRPQVAALPAPAPPPVQSTPTTPAHTADYAAHIPRIVHQQSRFRLLTRFSNQFVAVSVGVLAIVIIAGFFLSQAMPQIDARLASIHAGFGVQLPSYTPPGFTFAGNLQAEPGTVTVKYQSVTDSREYIITEQSTNWNDQTLAHYVASTGMAEQSWLDKGRTVYLYGNHLTWVSAGVWYQITDRADLTASQLIDVATSM